MNPNQEIEAKFCILHSEALEDRLKKLGAKLVHPRTHERNLRFDTPQLELTRQNRLLRLRKDYGNRLTFKGPTSLYGGIHSREEIEFLVDDFDTAVLFLKALGYEVSVIYEKYRTTYLYDDIIITLDEMPYGLFVELEGPDAESIQACAEKLTLTWEARLTETYLTLFERTKKALRLDFRDLTFENFEDVEMGLEVLGVEPADVK